MSVSLPSFRAVALLFLTAGSLAACAATPEGARAAPRSAATSSAGAAAAAADFIDAFNAMDLQRFRALFAEDSSVFFPSAPFPLRRIEGREAVLQWFGKFFESARKRTARLNITPQDLRIQAYEGFAVATFHLGGSGNVGRRTLVLSQAGGRWQIVHLHASALPEQAPAAAQRPNG